MEHKRVFTVMPCYPILSYLGDADSDAIKYLEEMNSIIRSTMGTYKHVTLIGTGSSGAVISTWLLAKHNEDALYSTIQVMKPNETGHRTSLSLIFPRPSMEETRYIIVDDFVASGQTVLNIFRSLKNTINGYVDRDRIELVAHRYHNSDNGPAHEWRGEEIVNIKTWYK